MPAPNFHLRSDASALPPASTTVSRPRVVQALGQHRMFAAAAARRSCLPPPLVPALTRRAPPPA